MKKSIFVSFVLIATSILTFESCKKKPVVDVPGMSDSLYIVNAIAAVEGRQAYSAYRNTLINYCRIILQQKKLDAADKEVKIMITEKQIDIY